MTNHPHGQDIELSLFYVIDASYAIASTSPHLSNLYLYVDNSKKCDQIICLLISFMFSSRVHLHLRLQE